MQNFIYPVSSNKNCFPNIEKKTAFAAKKVWFSTENTTVLFFFEITLKCQLHPAQQLWSSWKCRLKYPARLKLRGRIQGEDLGFASLHAILLSSPWYSLSPLLSNASLRVLAFRPDGMETRPFPIFKIICCWGILFITDWFVLIVIFIPAPRIFDTTLSLSNRF